MMTTDTDYGPFPYAGVPWFSTPFGRDSIITALECCGRPRPGAWRPRLSRGHTGHHDRRRRDAQPGKILHEARDGEMAALGEIPFGRYYGSHDATPLFVVARAEPTTSEPATGA